VMPLCLGQLRSFFGFYGQDGVAFVFGNSTFKATFIPKKTRLY
jgi:hypothetical protein